MAKRKGKNLTAQGGWSTIMEWQGSYHQVGSKTPQSPVQDTLVLTANLRDSKKTCFLFSKIHLNMTKLTKFML